MPPAAAPAAAAAADTPPPDIGVQRVRWRLVHMYGRAPDFFHCDDTGESRWDPPADEAWEADF